MKSSRMEERGRERKEGGEEGKEEVIRIYLRRHIYGELKSGDRNNARTMKWGFL